MANNHKFFLVFLTTIFFLAWYVLPYKRNKMHNSALLIFEILRKEWPDEKTPGVPYGIRIDKDKNHQILEFFSTHSAAINQWGLFLEKKINQRNFHKLFKAKKKIGKGAFATVYLAERLADKKMVAIKAFSKEKQFSGDKGKQSLENEIKIMRGIDHPNIMKLQGVFQTQNSIYVILEYLEGPQLNEELKNGRKYTQNESLKIIKQILQALKHQADHRIIHRDLKPQNIMFKNSDSLQLSICDFGLATYADEQKYLFVRCGTPGFVAPEIINIKDMTTKSEPISDVFSAGIIFHYLLFGHSVFPGKKYNDVLSQNRSCDFSFQSAKYEDIGSATLHLLKKMLEKNQKNRISASEGLKHEVFEHQMDIEEYPLKQKNISMSKYLQKEKEKSRKSEFSSKNCSMINENSSYVSNKNDSSKKGFPSFNTTVSSHYPKVRPQYNKML